MKKKINLAVNISILFNILAGVFLIIFSNLIMLGISLFTNLIFGLYIAFFMKKWLWKTVILVILSVAQMGVFLFVIITKQYNLSLLGILTALIITLQCSLPSSISSDIE